jgi:uncharacterized protein DUF4232
MSRAGWAVALAGVVGACGGNGSAPTGGHHWIPSSVRAVAISVASQSGLSYPVSTVTRPPRVVAVIRLLDGFGTFPPRASFGCPEVLPTEPLLRFRFSRSPGSKVLLSATQDGCVGLQFSNQKGGRGPDVWVKLNLVTWLWRHYMLPACSSVGVTARYSIEDPNRARSARSLTLIDRKSAACAIIGWPQVQLLGKHGRRLPTHETRRPADVYPPTPILIDRSWTATSLVSWTQTAGCHGPQATAFRIRPPGSATPETIPVSSTREHPALPCQGRLIVTGASY